MSWAFWQECQAPETTLEPGGWGQSPNGLHVCAGARGESGWLAPVPAKPSRQELWTYWAFSSTSNETSLAVSQKNTSYIKHVEHMIPQKCHSKDTWFWVGPPSTYWIHSIWQSTRNRVTPGDDKGEEGHCHRAQVLFFCKIFKWLGHGKIKSQRFSGKGAPKNVRML